MGWPPCSTKLSPGGPAAGSAHCVAVPHMPPEAGHLVERQSRPSYLVPDHSRKNPRRIPPRRRTRCPRLPWPAQQRTGPLVVPGERSARAGRWGRFGHEWNDRVRTVPKVGTIGPKRRSAGLRGSAGGSVGVRSSTATDRPFADRRRSDGLVRVRAQIPRQTGCGADSTYAVTASGEISP